MTSHPADLNSQHSQLESAQGDRPQATSGVISKTTSEAYFEQIATPLTNCDREPIRTPNQIQPHGVLVVLAPATLEIFQVSANVESQLDMAPDELLGQPLGKLIGDDQAQTVRQAILTSKPNSAHSPLRLTLPLRGANSADQPDTQPADQPDSQPADQPDIQPADQPDSQPLNWRGLIHTDSEIAILELIPRQPHISPLDSSPSNSSAPNTLSSVALHDQLRQSVHRFQQARSPEEIANIVVETVQAITGINRVMVYKLGYNYSGAVIAEAIQNPELKEERFLNLRFPATDIPVQARQLYLENWLRLIPDVGYTPVPLVPECRPHAQHPTDLGATELRSVSPVHIEYLQNLRVKASMSVSLVIEDRLWGLIACHHPEPKYVDYEARKICEILGQLASVELFRQQTMIEKTYQAQVRAIQQQIRQTISQLQPAHAIESVLIQYQQELLTLVQASGAVIALGSQMTLIGKTPPASRIRPMLDWLAEHNQDIYHTQALSQAFGPASQDTASASGLLAISIFLPEVSYHILWFRSEQKQSVHWAGNPNKPAIAAADGSLYLTPRQSFKRWQETVYEQSLPWKITEIAAAQDLRATLLLTALEFSRSALRESAKKAQVANQAKSQFLAKMSHELRTPLNAILGFSQLIHYHETLSSEQRDRLDIINRSGEHLLSLINDVLETSRIEAGQPRLNESCFDLHQFIASVRDMLALRAMRKGLLLKLEKIDPLPQYVRGDESKLRQIITNLVGNAVKFTAQGEVMLKVSSVASASRTSFVQANSIQANAAQDKVRVQFEVADTGPGIAPENFKVIFEPFHQTETGRNAYEGSGLGLSISRQNARLMGGDIEVRSQLQQGSTFICNVQLGVATAADLRPTSLLRKVVSLSPDQPSYRILVVEDVIENRQLLVSLLTTVGLDVCAVENGAQAVALWREWRPHCIWMDLYMPEMDGYEATHEIRAIEAAEAAGQTTTIIALSASVLDHMRDEVMEAGFDDYVCKPFRVNEIFDKMHQHLGMEYQHADEVASQAGADSRSNIAIATAETWHKQKISSTQAQLKRQPIAWQRDFAKAVLGARERTIKALIAQLPDEHQDLADLLSSYVNQLAFDTLNQLVEPLMIEPPIE